MPFTFPPDRKELPYKDLIVAVLEGKQVRRQYESIGPARYIVYATDAAGQAQAIYDILTHPIGDWSLAPQPTTHYLPVYRAVEGHNGQYVGQAWTSKAVAADQTLHGEPPAAILIVTVGEDLKVISSRTEPV